MSTRTPLRSKTTAKASSGSGPDDKTGVGVADPAEPGAGDRPRDLNEAILSAGQSIRSTVATSNLTRAAAERTSSVAGGIGQAWHRLNNKRGGVAPFVEPSSRLDRRLRLREWQRRGFVPLSPGRQKLRHRILPRTVIGIVIMLLAMSVGAAFSGAAFYAYYDNRLAENERAVARFVDGFDQQFTGASGALDDMRVDAITEIRDELDPLGDYVADANGVVNLPVLTGPSVWLVETRDDDGEIASGSAFAVLEHGEGTAMITSYELVRASTTTPSPGIDLLKGNNRIPAQLWSWDEERDLALLLVEEEIPTLPMASEQAQVDSVGARVFALSGVGGQGATASPGVLLDHSQVGLQHTAPVGTLFRGGPLLTGDGKVVGVASNDYRPFGLDPGDVRQAVDVRGICAAMLACAEIDDEVDASVVAEETEAPPRGDEPVRTVEPSLDEVDEPESPGEEVTIDPNDPQEPEDGDAGGGESEDGESEE